MLRLGFIANFLSRAVLIGFLTGVGFQVAIGQVPGLFGLPKTGSGPIEYLANTVRDLGSASWLTFGIAIATLVIIVGLEKVNKRIPGALLAVVGMIVLSAVLDWQAEGVSVLGVVPGGLPQLGLPQGVTTQDIWDMLPTAFSIFIVILAQSAATSRAYAMRYNDSFNENVDLVGLSAASLGAGLSGTFVVNGSPTKTEMVDHAGGRSQLAQLTCGAIVLIVLLFLTKPLEYMPNAVLAAVVFLIGIKLIDLKGMRDIATLRRGEFWVAAVTAIVVVFVGVEQGIIVAMVLSVIEHLSHSYKPLDLLFSRDPSGAVALKPIESSVELAPGLLVYRFGSGLYYANSSRFTEEIMDIIEGEQVAVRWLGLSGSAIADVDYQGGATLAQLVDELKDRGVTVALVDLTPNVRSQLDAFGLTAKVGADKVFDSLGALEAAYAAGAPNAS